MTLCQVVLLGGFAIRDSGRLEDRLDPARGSRSAWRMAGTMNGAKALENPAGWPRSSSVNCASTSHWSPTRCRWSPWKWAPGGSHHEVLAGNKVDELARVRESPSEEPSYKGNSGALCRRRR